MGHFQFSCNNQVHICKNYWAHKLLYKFEIRIDLCIDCHNRWALRWYDSSSLKLIYNFSVIFDKYSQNFFKSLPTLRPTKANRNSIRKKILKIKDLLKILYKNKTLILTWLGINPNKFTLKLSKTNYAFHTFVFNWLHTRRWSNWSWQF